MFTFLAKHRRKISGLLFFAGALWIPCVLYMTFWIWLPGLQWNYSFFFPIGGFFIWSMWGLLYFGRTSFKIEVAIWLLSLTHHAIFLKWLFWDTMKEAISPFAGIDGISATALIWSLLVALISFLMIPVLLKNHEERA